MLLFIRLREGWLRMPITDPEPVIAHVKRKRRRVVRYLCLVRPHGHGVAGRVFATDAKMQLALQSEFDGVQCHEGNAA